MAGLHGILVQLGIETPYEQRLAPQLHGFAAKGFRQIG
jgi:hypothetical protein